MAKKDYEKDINEMLLGIDLNAPTTKQPETKSAAGASDADGSTVPAGMRIVRESRSEHVQLLLTPTIHNKLKELAAAENISKNELANRIFSEYISAVEKTRK